MAKPTELTDWAIDVAALKTATDSQRWNFGWTTPGNDPTGIGEKPNLNQQNYWQNAVHKWIEYLDAEVESLNVRKTPLGTIIAVASNLAGAFDSPTGVVTDGFILCDGSAIPAGHPVTGNAPQLTDDRFLMGSTVAGNTGGDNVMEHTHTLNDHKHTLAHTHGLSDGYACYTGSLNEVLDREYTYVRLKTVSQWTTTTKGFQSGVCILEANTTTTAGVELGGSTDDASTTYTGTNNDASDGASNTENRPKYLSVKYFLKVDI